MRLHLYTTWGNVRRYIDGYEVKCWTQKEALPLDVAEKRIHIDVDYSEIIRNGGALPMRDREEIRTPE